MSAYRDWLSRIDKDMREARDKRIRELWMACWTQEEIAEAVGVSVGTVNAVCSEMADLPELNKPSASHLTDFDVPLYNVWKFTERKRPSRLWKINVAPFDID